ncbi:hypothetical protein [Streptomyces sp. NBC_00271]|uniref:hypothetical protein n=1 Tax=Streptomyces sp. NBC_00271 TaxID=2975697 RepID=UPI002E293D2A|nr:hypothetical protein [Streptomyces sp. NBC_00271]
MTGGAVVILAGAVLALVPGPQLSPTCHEPDGSADHSWRWRTGAPLEAHHGQPHQGC